MADVVLITVLCDCEESHVLEETNIEWTTWDVPNCNRRCCGYSTYPAIEFKCPKLNKIITIEKGSGEPH